MLAGVYGLHLAFWLFSNSLGKVSGKFLEEMHIIHCLADQLDKILSHQLLFDGGDGNDSQLLQHQI